METTLSVDEWASILEESRVFRCSASSADEVDNEAWRSFSEHFGRHLHTIKQQLNDCCAHQVETVSRQDLLKTRKALCLIQTYLSIPVKNDEESPLRQLRRRMQQETCEVLLDAILRLVCTIQSIDKKCLQLVAQVLCNLVTDCEATSLTLVTTVSNNPSHESVAARILGTESGDLSPSQENEERSTVTVVSWVDLLLACSSFRPALAPMAACLHNCLASLSQKRGDNMHFVESIASSSLLVSTLLRQIVSAESVQKAVTGCCGDKAAEANEERFTDEATEWISLTLARLSRAGFLTHMYQAIAGKTANDDISENVLPEQVVLLHCIRKSVEDCRHGVETRDRDCGARCLCLGGESLFGGYGSVEESHLFLVHLFLSVRKEILAAFAGTVASTNNLQTSTMQLILDILAETLSEDSRIAAIVRKSIGAKSNLIQKLLQDLGAFLDAWLAQNEDKKVRDQVQMTDDQQRFVITATRVLGNLCFHCPQNQDTLRTTLVPLQVTLEPKASHSGGIENSSDRNGLHVLLSTTSMAYTCFTLREWAVVAIRSALEDNMANQALVAELEARSAVQSAALRDLGIRVDLDVARGRVSVNPLPENDCKKQSSGSNGPRNKK